MGQGRKRKYTNDDIVKAVKESEALRQVLPRLGLKHGGGNFSNLKKWIEKLNIDTSHFHGKGWRRGCKNPIVEPIPLEKILIKNSTYKNLRRLKIRLIRAGIFEEKCYNCGNTIWMGKPIPLELEHTDGDKRNNSIENIKLLCPNCHAQTKFYRGKNIKSYRLKMIQREGAGVGIQAGLKNR